MNETWWVDPKQLNPEQRRIIELPLGGSHLITGPPGSGKTNLLLLRANYMTLANQPNINIIVFTKTLQEFIAAGGAQYAFPASKVQTCMRWQLGFLKSFGVSLSLPGTFSATRLYLIEEIKKLLHSGKGQKVYDAILLDEAQDYLPDEITIFKKVSTTLFASAHTRQKLYQGIDTTYLLESLTDEKHSLNYHYRIGTRICRLADALLTGDQEKLLPTSNYNEFAHPSSVEFFSCADIDEEARQIIENLSVQVRAYPDELLGVLLPGREATFRIWERLMNSDLASLCVLQVSGSNSPFDRDTRICVSTVHAAKGLEFRALHIAECNDFEGRSHDRNMVYTAITRAKTSLSLYCSAPIPGYLEKALKDLEPLPDLPSIDAVFGGGSNVD